MKSNLARALLVFAGAIVLALAPLQAAASRCTAAALAGNWAYTYTGALYTPDGPVPAASVGHFSSDSSGNFTGGQTRTVAGSAAQEDVAGSFAVNKDCTASASVSVYIGGVLQRTAVLALAYDSDLNHARLIFVSLTLPDGTNVPVVLTGDGNRVSSKD
jgi:hypothetical protein